jgi:hypothetical protein
MRNLRSKRFGVHEVTKGKRKGALHVATRRYSTFTGELGYLELYLNTRLLPKDPEESQMAAVILNLQNIFECELESAIADFVSKTATAKNQAFLTQIHSGFVAFKTKFEWAMEKNLLSQADRDVMEQIRLIRNAQTHARPTDKRVKHEYFGIQLMTRAAIIRMFTDANKLVLKLRSLNGSTEKWQVIPPGFGEEVGWYREAKKTEPNSTA